MRFASPRSIDLPTGSRAQRILLIALALTACDRASTETGTASTSTPSASATSTTASTTPAARAEPPEGAKPPEGAIVFVSERDGRRAIYRVPVAGGTPELLARSDVDLYPGPIGPKGEIVVVTSHGEEGPESLGLVADGKLVTLGTSARHMRSPAWFPDGQVAFESDAEGFRDLYRVTLPDGTPERLTRSEKGSFEPSVHPSGKRIAFAGSDGGDAEIYLREEDGTLRRLTYSKGHDGTPRFSPDGTRIAFLSARRGVPRVFVMRAEGQEPHMLSREPRDDAIGERDHAWSPDGTRIAFVEQLPNSRTRLLVVDVASGTEIASSDGTHVDEAPAWSPDGRWLAFTSSRDGQSDIFLMRLEGGAVRRVTDHPAADWLPRWQP